MKTTNNSHSHCYHSRRQFLFHMPAATALAALAWSPANSWAEATSNPQRFDVKTLGARGDGVTLDTAALQQAIDRCARQGGGTVTFPPGQYLSGTLFLKSHVTLDLESGATLVGSRRLEDYPSTISEIRSYTDNYTERSLLYGEQVEDIGIHGRGIIDGQGAAFKGPYKVRPYILRLIGSRNISVRGVTFKNSPMWVQHYLACDGLAIDGITVASKCNANNDGIDIDGCQRVRIANCDIQSGDDAIVLKSTLARPCKQIAITNCLLSSDCNAFKLGTESNGGFENIVLSNCAMYNTHLAGIALETVDGGILNGVNISNITMQNVRGPIFLRLGHRARPFQKDMEPPGRGSLRNVSISDVQAIGADRTGCCIAGLPGHPIENVTLRNIRLGFSGGGKFFPPGHLVAERPEAYPEYSMFGPLPAYGFFCRHVRNLAFEQIDLTFAAPDERAALVCEDVDELRVSAWNSPASAGTVPVMDLYSVRDALIHGCRAPRLAGSYVRVSGKDSARIKLAANDFSQAAKDVQFGDDAQPGAAESNASSGG